MKIIEWDDIKAKSNISKHGIDFREAALIFKNPVIEVLDDREDYGETRLIAIGDSGKQILIVVYADYDSFLRIISARKANKHDSRHYYEAIYG
jgi:uncharacterized protein